MVASLISIFSATGASCQSGFFGLKSWYYYLKVDGQCNIKDFAGPRGNDINVMGSNFALILLAILDDLLRVAGIVAIAFVIYGGILYVTSQGSPEQTQKAQNTIQNALLGLVIALVAVAMVSFIGSKIR
jgi:hypothetical protein